MTQNTIMVVQYVVALSAAVVVRAGAYFWVQSFPDTSVLRPLGPYDVAFLGGGSSWVVETAVAGLVESGGVTVHHGRRTEYRPGPDAARRVRDPVQREVLVLLQRTNSLTRLALLFARTGTAADLRRGLVSAGFLLSYPGRTPIVWVGRALIPLAVIAMGLLHGVSRDAAIGVLVFAGFGALVVWAASETVLPLAHSRRARRLKSAMAKVVAECTPSDKQRKREEVLDEAVVRQVRGIVTARAGEWGLATGWAGSAIGMVPFMGWKGYTAERAELRPLPRSWSPGSRMAFASSGPRRGLGFLFRVLGVACVLAALGGLVRSGPGYLTIGLLVVLSLAGAWSTTLGKKHLAADGREVLRTSVRPPVLYLRSFEHDAMLEQASPFRWLLVALGSRSSYIEEVVRAVRGFGKVVAIGDPGAPLPGLGPAQIHVPEDATAVIGPGWNLQRWQAEVLGLLHHASLVLISAGHSEGLRWEFAQATSRVPPERLVILVPLDRAQYARFRERTQAYFRSGLPADPRKHSVRKNEEVHGLIYFDRDWTPHFVAFHRHALLQLHRGRIAIRPSLRRLRNRLVHALYPVFHSNRVFWPGIVLPVPFGRSSDHRVVPGLSAARTLVLLVALAIADALISKHLR
ncbi:TIGR04222 domain-containing membrane protein [Saccharopolyspora mangrovi]|uniref:TIGR04222 domain-containing membrane protein n=1 Tax=Saccharopolyspora mangrovi TaxID=3082379 RepID=A0ABU6AEE8_9PSEU|nr:TIGR04222 domain-containing membrane protein [Saccharopolyspora sp. S2-29]MEB3369690.1 TIGR04222 domain-containing membrane protein [Saccharopolyspora sp. S2-29]